MILDFILILFYGFWCHFIAYFLDAYFSPLKHTYRELYTHKIWLILLVIQFSPLLLQPRGHRILFMLWSNSFLQLFRDFFLVLILPFGGCFSKLFSFLLKYVHGLLIWLCSWSGLVLELQWPLTATRYGAVLLAVFLC